MDNIQRGLKLWRDGASVERKQRPAFRRPTTTLAIKRLSLRLYEEPLDVLKKELCLDGLNKEMVRSLAGRFTGTDQHIKHYGRMMKEELIQALVERGFQR